MASEGKVKLQISEFHQVKVSRHKAFSHKLRYTASPVDFSRNTTLIPRERLLHRAQSLWLLAVLSLTWKRN